ncbi:hypothetical protein A2Z10_02725 [Candidatus Azambacteria bacterium RBG_16_47_10]|uniref:Uncharacterized protein n=1 Tax=Candidatus Azambacteria bacterium RBG_16_47_10 TaxID=1797292 RepID=A0A1F5B181_9BACT|nr:MAG: hypothetical protein A2Z10_02725 [Candidatus Azambacteria bacterium RBG_16_47_10]
MQFNAQKFALAATITMGIAYVICAAFTALNPELAMKFLGWIIHLTNVDKFTAIEVTFGSFIASLVPILAYTYFGAYLFAWLYNKLNK